MKIWTLSKTPHRDLVHPGSSWPNMADLDWVLGGWLWYRRLRGGTWDCLSCPDGYWYQVKP